MTQSPTTVSRFLRSSIASGLSQGWRVLVTFGAMLFLRRWVPVEDWGLYSWALVVFMLLGAVRDLGLAYHVLRLSPRPFGNLLLLEVVWGGGLAVAVAVAAPALVAAYPGAHPDMVGVLRLLTLFLIFEGLSSVPKYYFDSELAVERALMPEVLRNLCFVGLSLSMAAAGFGVWSLVIAQVAGAGLYAVLMWLRAWGEIPLHYEKGRTLELVFSSLPLACIWFLIILMRHVDPLVLGLRFDFEDIGNYTFAYEWATIASVQVLLPAVTRSLYPALVAFGHDTREVFRTFSVATRLVIGVEALAAGVLFLNAELVLRLVGGAEWHDAPTYLRILCFAPLLDPFSRLGGELLKARHLDRVWIISCLVTVFTFAGGGYVATGLLGPVGMAWVNLVPLGGAVMAWALYRVDPGGFTRLFADLTSIYALTLPGFLLAALVPHDFPVWRFAASCVAAAVGAGFIGWRHGGDILDFFRQKPRLEEVEDAGEDRDEAGGTTATP